MCQEAVCEILNRSASQPWFLKEMLRNPEKTLNQFSLTLDEKRALLMGSISAIEVFAGQAVSPLLKRQFESAMHPSSLREAYLIRLMAEAEINSSLADGLAKQEVAMAGQTPA